MTIRVTLSEYIQDVGVAVVAKNANASESTVKAWRYFNRVQDQASKALNAYFAWVAYMGVHLRNYL